MHSSSDPLPDTAPDGAHIVRLTIEHHAPGAALGIGHPAPRLSWQVRTSVAGWVQERCEVELLDGAGTAVASTGPTMSGEQVLTAWPFPPLISAQAVRVQVRVAAAGEDLGPWSASEPIEVGLLDPADWSAAAITGDAPGSLAGGDPGPAPRLRREFEVAPGLVTARLRLSALGLVEAHLNGARVGDEELAPGWTSYSHRLRYRTHDVTDLLHEGPNALGALLGNGWYRGRMTWLGLRGFYGDRRALVAQLELTYADGRTERVVSDGSWRWAPSHVRFDDFYDGCVINLASRDDTWLRVGFDDSSWSPVEEVTLDANRLVAPEGPPVRRLRSIPAQRVWASPEQGRLVDFGENIVGWVRLRARATRGPAGREVVVRHAEVLDDGRLGVRPLRSARATDTYLPGGSSEEVLEPAFTFHGFRYAEVTGLDDLRVEDLEAVVIGSDLERTGWFDCSEPDLVTFHDNVVRGMQGNFVDVPTDCPQRDERLGWTGDLQVFSPTASFLFDTAGFLTSWLADLAADQSADGTVPFVVPQVLPGELPPTAAWGDAAVVVPHVVHERAGDLAVLERQWVSMTAWVERLEAAAEPGGLWTGGFQFGDWLDPSAPPEDAAKAKADPDVVATAQFARSARLLADAAAALGRTEIAARFADRADHVRGAFRREYVTPAGRVLSDSPTVYAQALTWGLLGNDQRARAGDRLADLVRTSGYRISTGFVGTPLIMDALVETGHVDVAYRLLLQRSCPSWLYPVTMGATTIWERWDSMLPDGSINPGEMTSFNHYALGAVADWLHRTVAGLAPAAPGYRRITVRPLLGGGLTQASTRHLTPYGEASVAWRVLDDTWHMDVLVPAGTHAQVHLPDGSPPLEVGSGAHTWSLPWPSAGARADGGLTMDSPARGLLDNAVAWAAVAPEFVSRGIGADDAAVAQRSRPYLEGSIEDLAARIALPGDVAAQDELVDAVRRCLEALVGH